MCKGLVSLLLIPLLAVSAALAKDIAPDVLLKAVTLEVVTVIRGGRDLPAAQAARLAELVETSVLPHFDFVHMTRIAVAGLIQSLSDKNRQRDRRSRLCRISGADP